MWVLFSVNKGKTMYCLGQWLSVSIINNKKKGIKELRCSQIFSNSQREYRIRIAGERTAGTGLEKALLENRRLQRVRKWVSSYLKSQSGPGRQKAGYDPTVCPGGSEGQLHPWL